MFVQENVQHIDIAAWTSAAFWKRWLCNNYVALWGLAQRPRGASVCKKVLYFVPVKKVKDNAVCPVESYQDVKSTAGLDHITEHVTTSGI